MRRWLIGVLAVVFLAVVAAAWFFFWPAALAPAQASVGQPTGAALVGRGGYLTRAGDCAACHTAPGGQPFAGGLAFRLPFGTIYSPNITPDKQAGIGAWSDAEFVRALHHGIGRNGEELYPAFHYASYAVLSTDDVLAIRAYLATLRPVRTSAPADALTFPFNQRFLMRAWDLLFVPKHPFQSDRSQSAMWNRGAYLVNGLGHCGECHTPRNILTGLNESRRFAGAEQVGWLAYNLTKDPAHGLGGWSNGQIAQYLATGQADGHGPASGPMAEVVEKSLHYLTSDDISATVLYLRSVPAQASGPAEVQAGSLPPPVDVLGDHVFAEACAGFHLPNGEGRQSPWAALLGASTTADPAGTNLVQALTQGTEIRTDEGLMFMHPFTAAYSDAELAAVARYVTAQFGHQRSNVTPDQIQKMREAASE